MKTLKKVLLIMATSIAIIAISNISNATTVRVTGDTLNVRKEASTSSDVIAMLSKDVECELLGEEGDFYKIKYQNYTGFISKQYAEIVGENNETDADENEPTNTENEETTSNNQTTNSEPENATNNDNQSNSTENGSTTENEGANTVESENNSTAIEKTLAKNTDIRILPLIYASVLENNKEDITVLVITEINGWSYIQTDEINGWVRTDKLDAGSGTNLGNESNNQKNDTDPSEQNSGNGNNSSDYKEKTGYISEEYVNVRSGPSTEDKVIKILTLNSEVTITGEEGDWYKVKSGEDEGYISKEFVSDTEKTVSRSAEPRTTSENSLNKTNKDEQVVEETNKNNEETSHTNSTTTKGEEVVAYAKQYLGCPYVYGAAGSKSFDCSGFTMYVYKHFGINLPHGATSQSRYGTKVSKNNLRAGDIIFLTDYETGVGIGHCGIYIGDGNFIHASTTGYKVRISSLDVEYAGRFYSAIRLL